MNPERSRSHQSRDYHRTCQYILERGVDFSPDKKSFVATHVLATRVLATNVHETSLQLRLCTRESRDPRHRGLSVSNGEVRTLGKTKFFELLDALVASLQPRETLHQSRPGYTAPRVRVPLAHDFPCLFTVF